jgi:hypothetical protein
MKWTKVVVWAFLALVVTFGGGYAVGGSGRLTTQTALDEARGRLDLAEARGQILEARVSLYNMNFGDASKHLEDAKAPLRRVHERYQQVGKNAAASSISAALEQLAEGQRLAGKLDQAANSKANDALEAIRVATSQ